MILFHSANVRFINGYYFRKCFYFITRMICPTTARSMLTDAYEAVELRDGEERYCGKGVEQACHYVNTVLADAIIGENVYRQAMIDQILRSYYRKYLLFLSPILQHSMFLDSVCSYWNIPTGARSPDLRAPDLNIPAESTKTF